MCFLGLRGAAYFFCSLHLADALFLLWTFSFDVIHLHNLWWQLGPIAPDDPNLTGYFVLIGFYIFISIGLGAIIFRGIELESIRVLAAGGLAFAILQLVACITTICLWYPIPYHEDPFELLEKARIGRFILRTLSTVVYLIILILYLVSLKRREDLEERHAVFGYRKPGSMRCPP